MEQLFQIEITVSHDSMNFGTKFMIFVLTMIDLNFKVTFSMFL